MRHIMVIHDWIYCCMPCPQHGFSPHSLAQTLNLSERNPSSGFSQPSKTVGSYTRDDHDVCQCGVRISDCHLEV